MSELGLSAYQHKARGKGGQSHPRCKLVNMACTPSCPDYARNLAVCGHPLTANHSKPRLNGALRKEVPKGWAPLALLWGSVLDALKLRLRFISSKKWWSESGRPRSGHL